MVQTIPTIPNIIDMTFQSFVNHETSDKVEIPRAKAKPGIAPITPRLLGPTSSDVNTNPIMIIPLRKKPVINLNNH